MLHDVCFTTCCWLRCHLRALCPLARGTMVKGKLAKTFKQHRRKVVQFGACCNNLFYTTVINTICLFPQYKKKNISLATEPLASSPNQKIKSWKVSREFELLGDIFYRQFCLNFGIKTFQSDKWSDIVFTPMLFCTLLQYQNQFQWRWGILKLTLWIPLTK